MSARSWRSVPAGAEPHVLRTHTRMVPLPTSHSTMVIRISSITRRLGMVSTPEPDVTNGADVSILRSAATRHHVPVTFNRDPVSELFDTGARRLLARAYDAPRGQWVGTVVADPTLRHRTLAFQ